MSAFILKLSYLIKDFWYPSFQYFLLLTYLLLLVFFIQKTRLKTIFKTIIINLCVFLLITITFWLSAEIYFRYIYDKSDSFGVMLTSQRWFKRHVADQEQLRGEKKFRDLKDFNQPKKINTTRIAVIGDSIAFGQGIENINDRFSNLLESKLISHHYPVEIYNFSRPGADFSQHQEYLNLILAQSNFDLVIWQIFPNDIGGPPSPHAKKYKEQVLKRQKNPLFKNLITNSFAFNYYYYRLSAFYSQDLNSHLDYQISLYEHPKIWPEAQEQITLITNQLKTHQLPVVVILFPYNNLIKDNYPTIIHDQITKTFESHKIPVIDLLDSFSHYSPEQLIAHRFDFHPSKLAHQIAANKLFELLSVDNYNYLFK